MPSFQFDIGGRGRTVGRFVGHVRDELQRAFSFEKAARKLSFQAIATALGVNRSVVHRQIMGVENMTLRSVADLAWAMGWYPEFSLKKIDTDGMNYFITSDEVPKNIRKTRTQTDDVGALELVAA